MRTVNGGGDQLARGASKVQFKPAEGVSKDVWAAAFDDLDVEKFRAEPNKSMQRTVPLEEDAPVVEEPKP